MRNKKDKSLAASVETDSGSALRGVGQRGPIASAFGIDYPFILDATDPQRLGIIYSPDCAACLRGRVHTYAEHEAILRRNAEASR